MTASPTVSRVSWGPIDATKGRVPLGTRQTRLFALIFSLRLMGARCVSRNSWAWRRPAGQSAGRNLYESLFRRVRPARRSGRCSRIRSRQLGRIVRRFTPARAEHRFAALTSGWPSTVPCCRLNRFISRCQKGLIDAEALE